MAERALTVSALTKYIKYKFDQDVHLKDVLLEGEISNFKHNVRGHFYFTLKDDRAQISAVMFKSNAWKVNFKPKEGMHVLVRGYISVFEVSGSYQIYVDSMEEVGVGNLYQAYLQLKEKLEKEGLFDPNTKQPLPSFPNQIAVLTSSTGAAVRDIIHIINRRYPLVKILIYPTTVQGENAKHEIVKNLELANRNPANDVIILGRGGGSIEDLWAFNEEIVARAIFDSRIPIVSAVGHETDFTIADFVADVRAPTPSGAAELVVPDQVTLHRDVEKSAQKAYDYLNRVIRLKRQEINRSTERYVMKDPSRLLMTHSKRYEYLDDKLRILHPAKRLDHGFDQLASLKKNLSKAMHQSLLDYKQHLLSATEHLDYVNPLNIMKKGYTLVRKEGTIIKSIDHINQDDTVEVSFYDGSMITQVKSKKKGDN